MNLSNTPNRLAQETSPYLLQHAHNPVDWFPWGEEALHKARAEDKPILLSIGYSACHWCHVMAHESFEDEETAARMNERCVNVKVDREERPDLDKIYQLAHQLLTRRSGGWPLTVFLNPHDQTPFFSGTYFPKTPRYQLPGFIGLLEQVARYYHGHKQELAQHRPAFIEALNAASASAGGAVSSEDLPRRAQQAMAAHFDAEWGGFGGAPKFPHAAALEFLSRGDEEARRMAVFSLRKMAEGGVFDQLGGGFYRYSVDRQWLIPHFEKMLYDNAPLLALCAQAWQTNGDVVLRDAAVAVGEWALREMQSDEGGYFSSLDADSEGHEGRFYLWRRQEARALLDEREYAAAATHFGLDETPNFEGQWHLYAAAPLAEVAERLAMDAGEAADCLASARKKLLAARAARVWPGRDEKILMAWNGLMIKGMARAGLLLGRADFIDSAARALNFLYAHVWRDGRLSAVYKDGRARFPAYLDDYAFLLDACLEMLQVHWRRDWLEFAMALAEILLARFEDQKAGGFFFTADDHESLLHRPKTWGDESMPAGAGVACSALLKLSELLGDERYARAAERALQAAAGLMADYPLGHGAMLNAFLDWRDPPRLLVLRGEAAAMAQWRGDLPGWPGFATNCYAIPEDEADLPGALAERRADGVGVTAYLCGRGVCLPPIRDLQVLREALSQ